MHGDSPNASGVHSARVFAVQEGHSEQRDIAGQSEMIRAQEHCVTSDLKVESEGKWFAVSKVLLTTCLCQGKDALIVDVPPTVIDVLRLTCPDVLEIASTDVVESPESGVRQ
jgi:hypothetical protein